ncbi:MAG TPA: DUF3347 domain-containing protein [Lacibacter sp.]|nr:DUF3347 domain-containing protein [Lacibacter sp.]HMO89581.1 DUF3347 domain-containing protein [Lacibacter sp.]HMP86140.1 DUF3347 domain-containing protein [Lacibacter sp.]
MKQLSVVLLLISLYACQPKSQGTGENGPSSEPANKTYSASFQLQVQQILDAYFNLKDAFVSSDTVAVNRAGTALQRALDSLSLEELLPADSLSYAAINGRPGDMVAEIEAMRIEKDLELKRESFEMISTALYDLLKAIRPPGTTLYFQYCPMAFQDKGAYWLSRTDSIRNPYFGQKMLSCGEVKEVLRYE